jgi:murein L,D-transpeptidase YcbB/YkuD
MIAQRGRAALMTSTALLLGLAAVLPAVAGQVSRKSQPMGMQDPDLFAPGGDARAALARLVAEPGVVLKAYAPIADGEAQDDIVLPSPDALRRTKPAAIAPVVASANRGDAALPTGSVASRQPSATGTAALPDLPRLAPDPSMSANAGPSDPMAFAPVSGDTPVLDAATLQQALAGWVGPEPALDRKPVPAEARQRAERLAIQSFYADRGFAPLWVEEGRFDARGRALLSRIDHAAEDGLDLHGVSVSVPHGGEADVLAVSEISLSEAAAQYGRQASGGRIDPSRIGPSVAVKPDVADPTRVLAALRDAADPAETLRAFNPPHNGYLLLRAKLAELRRNSEMSDRGSIPSGPALRPGMRDARVPLIRARFNLDIAPRRDVDAGLVYDTQVAGAVADYQRAHGLPASGVLTARTIASLSGGNPRRLEDEILANMERWRWLPRDLGQRYIAVNIPDYSLDLYQGDSIVHHARVVVGKPDHETPLFSETMKFVIVNPYWNVPLSIVKKEMMPKLAADPNYFANHGYETVERNGETFVRQPPGDSNALGHIKFMFPNRFSVYLHDTNARALFGKTERALSHGCVRVDEPLSLAEAVLGRDHGWTEARLARMVGGDERTINLPHPLPVHIDYFTAFVDQHGELHLRDDVYGYSARVRAALGLQS